MDLTQKSFPVNFSPGTFVFAKYWRWHLGRLIQFRDHYSLKWYFTFKDGASKIDPKKRPQEKDKKQKYMQQEIIITELWFLEVFFTDVCTTLYYNHVNNVWTILKKFLYWYFKVLEMNLFSSDAEYFLFHKWQDRLISDWWKKFQCVSSAEESWNLLTPVFPIHGWRWCWWWWSL